MSPEIAVLDRTYRAGLSLRAEGDRLLVSPADRLTPALRTLIGAQKPALLMFLAKTKEVRAELVAAINLVCDLRGDDATNRAGLIEEGTALPLHLQLDLAEHFLDEAARYCPKDSGYAAG